MARHALLPVSATFSENPFLRRLALVYVLFWAGTAISPLDRETWALENALVVITACLLMARCAAAEPEVRVARPVGAVVGGPPRAMRRGSGAPDVVVQ